MDVADLIRAGERVDVAVVLEILRRVLEPLAARLLLGELYCGSSCPSHRR